MKQDFEEAKPLARELSRELTAQEVEAVAGATGTLPGTIAIDQMYDHGDHWLPY